MGDPKSNCVNHAKSLRKNRPDMAASPSDHSKKRETEMEEIVRHMSNLPSYLERGKPIQDRALNFGVMDWGRLEKWQYHRHKQGVVGNNKYSPSGSNSSLLSSTAGSSPFVSKFQDFENAPIHRWKPNDLCKSKSSEDLGIFQTASLSSSSSKGKMKIEDDLVNKVGNFQDPSYRTCDRDQVEKHKTLVLVSPKDAPGNSRTNNRKSSSEDIHSEPNNAVLNPRNEANPKRNSSKIPEEKRFIVSSKISDFKTGFAAAGKPRSSSPFRRFSFSMNSKPEAPTKRADSPPVSRGSTKDNTRSSPLRRLLDPIFPSKATCSCKNTETPLENSKIKAKVKLDLRTNKIDSSSSSTKQALFQTAIKNGHPLFTFAVDNNRDILAATVRSLTGKDTGNSWIYTFFTVSEVKKKTGGWLTPGGKGKGHGFVPNIAAQMKVSNSSVSSSTTREFVLFSVNPSRVDHGVSEILPENELAAIVVRFLEGDEEEIRDRDRDRDRDRFSTTVILPGGHHSVPSKGEPSPLIERWRSGGACDCGGWDIGCRLRTLANPVQSSGKSNLSEVHKTSGRFELFFQGEALNERPFFSLWPIKDGIFSVEYDSSLSLLHAFSICISVMECRKSSQNTELRTYVAKQVVDDDEGPVPYASLPPLSSVERV